MPTVTTSGTQTAVINTEHTLTTLTGNKFYSAYVDLTNMQAADTVEIRVSVVAKTAGLHILYHLETYVGVRSSPLVYIAPLPSDLSWKLTLKQTTGTGRAYDWKVFEI